MNTLSLKKRAWTELEALFEEYKTNYLKRKEVA
jgi:hypothetical protein